MTDKPVSARCGWVFYDAQCRLCSGTARRFERQLLARGFQLVPLLADWVCARLGRAPGESLKEMVLLTNEGRIFAGAAAMLQITRCFWWASWLNGVARLPHGMMVLDWAYRWLAAHRSCNARGCCRDRFGLFLANTVFGCLPFIYAWVAWQGGKP